MFTPYPGAPIYQNKEHYEIKWDQQEFEEIWFSGQAQTACAVSTPYLSSKEILEIRDEMEKEFNRGKGGATDYWGPIKDKKRIVDGMCTT